MLWSCQLSTLFSLFWEVMGQPRGSPCLRRLQIFLEESEEVQGRCLPPSPQKRSPGTGSQLQGMQRYYLLTGPEFTIGGGVGVGGLGAGFSSSGLAETTRHTVWLVPLEPWCGFILQLRALENSERTAMPWSPDSQEVWRKMLTWPRGAQLGDIRALCGVTMRGPAGLEPAELSLECQEGSQIPGTFCWTSQDLGWTPKLETRPPPRPSLRDCTTACGTDRSHSEPCGHLSGLPRRPSALGCTRLLFLL